MLRLMQLQRKDVHNVVLFLLTLRSVAPWSDEVNMYLVYLIFGVDIV